MKYEAQMKAANLALKYLSKIKSTETSLAYTGRACKKAWDIIKGSFDFQGTFEFWSYLIETRR